MKKLLIVIIISTIMLVSCRDSSQETSYIRKKIEVKVGEYGVFENKGYKKTIRYQGLVNDKTFAIANGSRWAVNIFYPIDTKELVYQGKYVFEVEEVTPYKLTVIYKGSKEQ